ncbi:YcgL domain-containing protein [Halioglobus maricola]|uniref:YcgL domain-containing protein EY643_11085 n=1 Tax=Halioglobus maricola TaxID=2601894 RepID=A0A5P9NK97_9GAMM|nr:YcgL domain-containing protein [Halioglobus maricola]QFU76162.1 YcgL domain-containing protein [Halioglobus maricola]
MKLICEIFRSPQKEEMYLYVEKAKGLEDVPETLLKQFGEAESVMTIVLTPERKLARVDVAEVLEHIEANGFFLQMPPTPQELLRRNRAND